MNAATNGCSEMATALVTGIITMMFNWTLLLGVNGIWLATPVAELMALFLSVGMLFKYRKQYGY